MIGLTRDERCRRGRAAVVDIVRKVMPYVVVGIGVRGRLHGYVPEGALALPEMILLRKALKPRLIAVCVLVVATGILLVGYLFNLVV